MESGNTNLASLPLPLRSPSPEGGLRVRGALMGGIAPLLPILPGKDRGVARVLIAAGGRVPFPPPEAFQASRRLDQRPVYREVFIGQQATPVRLGHHFIKELLAHLVLQSFLEGLAVLGEHRGVEAGLHEVHVQKPPASCSQKARSLRTE